MTAQSSQHTLTAYRSAVGQQQWARARQLLESLLVREPGHALAHHELGLMERRAGHLGRAIDRFQTAVRYNPDSAPFHYSLGATQFAAGQLHPARASLDRCLELDHDFLPAMAGLGAVLRLLDENQAAQQILERALLQNPSHRPSLMNLGNTLLDAGQASAAADQFRKVIDLESQAADAWDRLGVALMASGDIDKADEAFSQALTIDPGLATPHRYRAHLRRYQDPDHPHIRQIKERLKHPGTPDPARVELHFALAKMLDDVGEYDHAMEQAHRANRLYRRINGVPEPDRHRQLADQIMQRFPTGSIPDRVQRPRGPLLIVSMPRSGSTLLEQMLARHADIDTAGECTWLDRYCTQERTWPPTHPDADADAYREELIGNGGARYVIDKMPTNFRWLGQAASLCPEARIVHLRRNPLDTCRSVYFTHFPVGNRYADDLDDLIEFHRQYRRLMDHWRREPALGLLEVDYEDLVAGPRQVLAGVLDHLDLPFDEACLTHQEASQSVHTASVVQVREPVHQRAVNRAAPYARHFHGLPDTIQTSSSDSNRD